MKLKKSILPMMKVMYVFQKDIRDWIDLFEFYNNAKLKRRFRLNKNTVLYEILPKIEEEPARINNRGLPISPICQLLICLRFYATGNFQMPCTSDAIGENQRFFKDIGRHDGGIGLSDIDGAIDCTHICVVGTRFYNIGEIYRNQKGYLSLNVQAVVGPRMEFLDIIPK